MMRNPRHKLSVAAINIGSKFDDRYSPSLESTFNKIWRTKLERFGQRELYAMEFEIFETLGYDTYAPSANHFLVHFFKKGHENRTEDKLNKLYNVSSKTKEEKTRLWNYYMHGYVSGFGDIIGLL